MNEHDTAYQIPFWQCFVAEDSITLPATMAISCMAVASLMDMLDLQHPEVSLILEAVFVFLLILIWHHGRLNIIKNMTYRATHNGVSQFSDTERNAKLKLERARWHGRVRDEKLSSNLLILDGVGLL